MLVLIEDPTKDESREFNKKVSRRMLKGYKQEMNELLVRLANVEFDSIDYNSITNQIALKLPYLLKHCED